MSMPVRAPGTLSDEEYAGHVRYGPIKWRAMQEAKAKAEAEAASPVAHELSPAEIDKVAARVIDKMPLGGPKALHASYIAWRTARDAMRDRATAAYYADEMTNQQVTDYERAWLYSHPSPPQAPDA